MIIKKFVGKTEEEAVAAARKELGEGVVIMNVKTLERKGFLGFIAPKQTEVTVALEEGSDSYRAVRAENMSRPGKLVKSDAPRPVPAASLSGGSAELEDRVSIEKKLDTLQTLLVNRFKASEAQREEAAGVREAPPAEEEPEEERQEITEQQRFLRLLYNTMLENEVDEKYANQIVGDFDTAAQPNLPFDHILANVYQKIVLKFGKAEGITPAREGAKIVLFMGPTGVGKTTTIAKIAGSYAVEEKKRVALLTADTYRIAAVEQLRTYANILEVPFRVVYTGEEMQDTVREFQGYDYIFIDTAGHSHRNGEQLNATKELFRVAEGAGECQTFLVLSATTKYRDLLRIVASYDGIADFQLIFTKLDETAAMGNLLNLKLYTGTPIAFVTNGQNVPSDIERFNPQKTVKQILTTRQGENA